MWKFLTFESFITQNILIFIYYIGVFFIPIILFYFKIYVHKFPIFTNNIRIYLFLITIFVFMQLIWRMMLETVIAYFNMHTYLQHISATIKY